MIGILDCVETCSFRLRMEVVGESAVSVMSRGGLRNERKFTVMERSAPGASFCRFASGWLCFGRMY